MAKNDLERFFDITKGEGLSSEAADPLSWESLTQGTNDNLGRSQNNTRLDFNSGTSSLSATGEKVISRCNVATDCGSGFNCVDGACIQLDSFDQSGGSKIGIASASSGGEKCFDFGGFDLDLDCFSSGCDESKAGCGSGSLSFSGCCGEPTYTCRYFDANNTLQQYYQCIPCGSWFIRQQCTEFCDDFQKANGETAFGCEGLDCGECSVCKTDFLLTLDSEGRLQSPFTCIEALPRKCNCKPAGQQCPDCQACVDEEDNGEFECMEGPGLCQECCECEVPCENDQTAFGKYCQDSFKAKTPVCNACREKAAELCPEPEPEDGCKEDPSDICLDNCSCFTLNTGCDVTLDGENNGSNGVNGLYTSLDSLRPSGVNWKVLGSDYYEKGCDCCLLLVGTNCLVFEERKCNPQASTSLPEDKGGKRWFIQQCDFDPNCVDGVEGDCTTDDDCYDCEKCFSNGTCQQDILCDDPCDIPCDGICCPPGSTCVDEISWNAYDINGELVDVRAARGEQVSTELISLDAVDPVTGNRADICTVLVNGVSQGYAPVNCNRGVTSNGPNGRRLCR